MKVLLLLLTLALSTFSVEGRRRKGSLGNNATEIQPGRKGKRTKRILVSILHFFPFSFFPLQHRDFQQRRMHFSTHTGQRVKKKYSKFCQSFSLQSIGQPQRNLLFLHGMLGHGRTSVWKLRRGVKLVGNEPLNSIICYSFGVCCVFILRGTGTISRNCSYIQVRLSLFALRYFVLQNTGFPSPVTGSTGETFTVNKCSNGRKISCHQCVESFMVDVCFLRLDFETFNLQGPADTNEVMGGACTDTFVVTVRECCKKIHPTIYF